MVLNRVAPVSVAKVAAVLYALIGLGIGAAIACAVLLDGLSSNRFGNAFMGATFGIGAILVLPILYGGLAFVATLIGTYLYNVAAGFVGGIEIDVK